MMPAEVEEQSASPLYPIREVSRLTGVNTVTLRAWERRYGLICPQRTPKGHRLYSAEDIETIRRVLQWLDKGVAVSQVGDLLDQTPQTSLESSTEGNWDQVISELQRNLVQQDEEQLDQLYSQLFSSWSGSQLVKNLLSPLVAQLPDDSASAALLARYLRSCVGARLHHRRPTLAGPKLLLLPLSASQTIDWPLLFALQSLADLDFRVFWLDTPLSSDEAIHLIQQQRPRLILTTNPQQVDASKLVAFCEKQPLPVAHLGETADPLLPQMQWLDSRQLHQLLQNKDQDH
ncbi:MAG: MerR family transcriptional regulator [Marinospirillum sp.]|nr:MerR family transcriptional regulator [Marinospirillum sp.]MDR9468613.1 MerR family transcriptional regulator [Marinospirillum sp.]